MPHLGRKPREWRVKVENKILKCDEQTDGKDMHRAMAEALAKSNNEMRELNDNGNARLLETWKILKHGSYLAGGIPSDWWSK